MPKFSFWVSEGALFSSATMLIDAFAIANLWQRSLEENESAPLFQTEILTTDGEPVTALGNIPVMPHGAIDEHAATDCLVIAPTLPNVNPVATRLERLGRWIERTTIGRLTLYNAVKNLSKGLIGGKEDGAFRSAILNSANGEQEIVYLVEDHGNGQVTVLVPWAPASFAGSVKIMSKDRIELLDASLGDTSRVLGHWGVGARDLLARNANTTHDQG